MTVAVKNAGEDLTVLLQGHVVNYLVRGVQVIPQDKVAELWDQHDAIWHGET